MADTFKIAQLQPFSLAGAGAIIGATSVTLKSFATIDSDGITGLLAMTDFGTIGFGTLQPGEGTLEEQICFTGVTQNANGTATLTGVKSVSFLYPYTQTSGLSKTHAGSTSFVISNTSGFYNKYAILGNDNAFTGYNTAPDPLSAQGLVTRDYMLALINGGPISVDSVLVPATAGETITQDDLVYLEVTDGFWYTTDANDSTTVQYVQLGIAQGAGTTGNAILNGVMLIGIDPNLTGTAGALAYASDTAGVISETPGTITKIVGQFLPSSAGLLFNPTFEYILTRNQVDALAGGGDFGTPSSTNKFITQSYNSSPTGLPIVRVYGFTSTGDDTTQFDITNTAGNTYRYTWNSTGTDPVINSTTFPIGASVSIFSPFMDDYNNGGFIVTDSGTDYFEVTNVNGVAESNKALDTAGFLKVATNTAWTKPAGLKYIVAEVVGGGGGGGGTTTVSNTSGGGGGGGYAKKLIPNASLGSTEAMVVGPGGAGGIQTGGDGGTGLTSSFGTSPIIQATGGAGGTNNDNGGIGGVGSSGDINANGSPGGSGSGASSSFASGNGGSSVLGGGAVGTISVNGKVGNDYGGGGSGAHSSGSDAAGGLGGNGVVIVTEYYS